ncbi:RING finger protein [Myxozyma melibiosi]|uniref:RBR-type E3 ubiquitin transferase n=1 Tax=Myxozyma melibiosi TaxID=54550 RepID=A0ABR1EZH2_9ASCO
MSDMSDDYDDDYGQGSDDGFGYESYEGSDYGDDGNDGFDDVKPESLKRKPYEIAYEVLSVSDIQKQQDELIEQVSSILGLSNENAMTLLLYFKWNNDRLLEHYTEDPEGVLKKAGVSISDDDKFVYEIKPVEGFFCDICCEDREGLMTFALECDHRFCAECYRQYATQKIVDEGESRNITCAGDCTVVMNDSAIKTLVEPQVYGRYQTLLHRTFVLDNEHLIWCPAPNCEYAVKCDDVSAKDLTSVVPTVTCKCGHRFCFGCGLPDHQPSICALVKKWIKKCEDDSETANWISAHTKECPKCRATIEKNGGCNHMTCRKCKYEFCWICIGNWAEHGTSWYNCSRYDEKSGVDARDSQAKSRASLERYLHYYNRYANHEQSAKLDQDLYVRTEKKMTQLQSTSGMSWIEVQYLAQASAALQECRQTLKWTYAFAFYLERNNDTHIFEDNQQDLELAVEHLSLLFGKPIHELAELKVQVMDRTAYCNKRRENLLSDTAKGLAEGRWKYQVQVK